MWSTAWGCICHDLLLFIASAYKDDPKREDRESMQLLIKHLFRNLPCLECCIEASAYIHQFPVDVSSRKALLQYLVTFHNHLNTKLGKKDDWTPLEAMNAASARYFSNLKQLSRAEAMRIEDHLLMRELVRENNQLKQSLGLPLRNDVDVQDYDLSTYYNSFTQSGDQKFDIQSVLLAVFSVLMFFIIIMCVLG
jgi:hypothetical protein